MFKKILAKFGVGAATIDLRLDQEAYRLGQRVSGVIHIEGGNVEQRISALSVHFVMRAFIRGKELVREVSKTTVLSGFAVLPKPHVQEIPFHFDLPKDLAISTPHVQYFFQTRLDVEKAADPTDVDQVRILPPERIATVLSALEQLAFRPKADSGKLTPLGQEFSFYPTRGFSAPLQELEVVFLEQADDLLLLVELDVRQPDFFTREREQRAEIRVPGELLATDKQDELAQFLLEKIEEYLKNPQAIPYFSTSAYLGRSYHGSHLAHHGHYSSPGIGGMLGGMAVGLLGGMVIGELMEDAANAFAADEAVDAGDGGYETESNDEGSSDGGGSDDFFGGGDFGGGDFGGGDFGGGDFGGGDF